MELKLSDYARAIPTFEGALVHDGQMILFPTEYGGSKRVSLPIFTEGSNTGMYYSSTVSPADIYGDSLKYVDIQPENKAFFPNDERFGQIWAIGSLCEDQIFLTAEDNEEGGRIYHGGYQKIIRMKHGEPESNARIALVHWQSEADIRNTIEGVGNGSVWGIGAPMVFRNQSITAELPYKYIMFYHRFVRRHPGMERDVWESTGGYPPGVFGSEVNDINDIGLCLAGSDDMEIWKKHTNNGWAHGKGGIDTNLDMMTPVMFPHIHWNEYYNRYVMIAQTTLKYEMGSTIVLYTAENPFNWHYEQHIPIRNAFYPALHPKQNDHSKMTLTYSVDLRTDIRRTALMAIDCIFE